jgi:hypothetical protein
MMLVPTFRVKFGKVCVLAPVTVLISEKEGSPFSNLGDGATQTSGGEGKRRQLLLDNRTFYLFSLCTTAFESSAVALIFSSMASTVASSNSFPSQPSMSLSPSSTSSFLSSSTSATPKP